MKKKVLGILLSTAMITSLLTGCGSSTQETGSTAPAASSTQAAAASTAAASSTTASSAAATTAAAGTEDLKDVSEPVTLSMMVTTRPTTDKKDFFVDYLPEMVHEKFPNITIEVEQLPSDEYKQNIRMKFANGEGPDLFTWWPQLQAQDLVDAGYVRDLSDFSQMPNFDQSIVKDYEFNGKDYAVPLGTSFLTTWYNKDMFKDAGITALPANWDEFLADCDKLKAKGYTPITCGDKDAFVIQFGIYQIGASTIYPTNMDFDKQLTDGTTKFTDPCWQDTVKKFAELYQKGYVIDSSLGVSQTQSRQNFIDGKAAMIFDGSFGYAALTEQGATQFERGMFCLPGNDAGKDQYYNRTPSNGLFTSAISDDLHQQACDLVMKYWFDQNSPLFKTWVENTTDIICYNGVKDTRPEINEYLDRYQKMTNIYNLNNAWPSGVSDAMTEEFQNVITGDSTPADVCQAMQDKFDEVSDE